MTTAWRFSSGFRPHLTSASGVTDPFDPRENIMAGARHLRRLLDLHDGDVTLAVAR